MSCDQKITIKRRFLFWTWEETYVGDCTVWYNVKTGRRPGTAMEGRLADIAAMRRLRAAGLVE